MSSMRGGPEPVGFLTEAVTQTIPGYGIDYHGGPILTGTTTVYLIWYGNWTGNTATTILPDFINRLSGSPLFNINTTYYNASHTPASTTLSYGGRHGRLTGLPSWRGTIRGLDPDNARPIVRSRPPERCPCEG
jgi:hypothetical protein